MIYPSYVPQFGIGADRRVNDCGLACCSCFLVSIGDFTPVDQLRTAEPTGLTTASDLVRVFAEHGVLAHIEKVNDLDSAKPNSILLVNYSPLRRYAQDTRFKGWHWLVYLSNDGQSAITLDPDYSGARIREGDHKAYPLAAMRSAFRPYLAGDLCTAVVVDGLMPIPEPTTLNGHPYRVVSDVNFRQWYSIKSNVVRGLAAGVVVQGYDRTYVNGAHTWRMVEHGGDTGWIADDYLKAAGSG